MVGVWVVGECGLVGCCCPRVCGHRVALCSVGWCLPGFCFLFGSRLHCVSVATVHSLSFLFWGVVVVCECCLRTQ